MVSHKKNRSNSPLPPPESRLRKIRRLTHKKGDIILCSLCVLSSQSNTIFHGIAIVILNDNNKMK